MRDTCKYCMFYDNGECHKLPPKAVVINGELRSLHPKVKPDSVVCKNYQYNSMDNPKNLQPSSEPAPAFLSDMSDVPAGFFSNCDGIGNREPVTIISLLDKFLNHKRK